MTSFTIAVSSCALFRLEEGDRVCLNGAAFPFVKALNKVNQQLKALTQTTEKQFKVVLITNNTQDRTRIENSLKNYKLQIDELCEIDGERPLLYHLNKIKPDLFLSMDSQNVREAINRGYGAATLFKTDYLEPSAEMLRVAFDGDGVLFSDESERIFAEKDLQAFLENERRLEDTPLTLGPLRAFWNALCIIQKQYEAAKQKCPIRTYLVTSRGTDSSGMRVLKTLKVKKLNINEAVFLDGAPKGPVLKAINPHIFFDDQKPHVDGALRNGVIGAHVPFGVKNE